MLKVLFPILVLSFSASAAVRSIDQVRTFDLHRHQVEVTLWGNNKVFRFSEDNPVVPCLENARKSGMRVDIKLNSEGKMVDCKLASLPHRGQISPAR